MKFGLTSEEFGLLRDLALKPLWRAGATIWCFGSRARGDHAKFSDLDLMVDSEQDLTRLMGEVAEAIANSNFPYKVDLAQLRDFAIDYRSNFDFEKKRIEDSDS